MVFATWLNPVLLVLSIIIIWVIGYIIRSYLKKTKMTPETYNAINLVILTSQVIMLILVGTSIYNVQSDAIIGASALFGTAIGFAIAVVIGNVVAGFYLITVRPFGIGDLIKVKGIEGIVMEIGLNYTKLLQLDSTIVSIPNKGLLDADLINCSIRVDDIMHRAEKGFEIGFQTLMEDLKDVHKAEKDLGSKLMEEIVGGQEIVRYPFTVQLKLNAVSPDIPLSVVNKRMEGLMDRWDEKLGFKPRYFYNKYIFRQDTRIVMVLNSPDILITEYPKFLEDLYVTVFEELQEVRK